ncbi:MAG: DUF4345 domain-containing protein [Solirubrobacterales bacterium]|nr:DUF4345 domain-containing protein [Solirubrobacterales bacterium]
MANGGACTAIGLLHVATGSDNAPGIGAEANINEDSQERFYGGIFAAYGAAWLWALRAGPLDPKLVRFLGGAMALGGAGRVAGIAKRGLPHPFWVAMAATEFIVPGLFVWLANADADADIAG